MIWLHYNRGCCVHNVGLMNKIQLVNSSWIENPHKIDRTKPYNKLKKLSSFDLEALINDRFERKLFEIDFIVGRDKWKEIDSKSMNVEECFKKEFSSSNRIEMIEGDNIRLKRAWEKMRGEADYKSRILFAASEVNPDAPKVRKSVVYVGSSHTPPAGLMRLHHYLGDIAGFVHNCGLHPLLKAFISHIQFELVHPLKDGNGRVGRLEMMYQIMSHYELPFPITLSRDLVFPKQMYYRALQDVMFIEDWLNSIQYFLDKFESSLIDTLNIVDER